MNETGQIIWRNLNINYKYSGDTVLWRDEKAFSHAQQSQL